MLIFWEPVHFFGLGYGPLYILGFRPLGSGILSGRWDILSSGKDFILWNPDHVYSLGSGIFSGIRTFIFWDPSSGIVLRYWCGDPDPRCQKPPNPDPHPCLKGPACTSYYFVRKSVGKAVSHTFLKGSHFTTLEISITNKIFYN